MARSETAGHGSPGDGGSGITAYAATTEWVMAARSGSALFEVVWRVIVFHVASDDSETSGACARSLQLHGGGC